MRVQQQPGFILHHRDYSETSLLLEVFTVHHGRIGLIAKGARRASSRLRVLASQLAPGEELLGVLGGWQRWSWGPRRAWLLLPPGRWLLLQCRWLRKPAVRSLPHQEVTMVRRQDTLLLTRLELLTRQNERITLHLPKTLSCFAALAGSCVPHVVSKAQDTATVGGARIAPASP